MFYLIFVVSFLRHNGFSYCDLAIESGGWDYVDLHCRDNTNAPVDWWNILKHPTDDNMFPKEANNFSYITPEVAGRWKVSERPITSDSMLQYTLSPMYRYTYKDNLAFIIYDNRKESQGSAGTLAKGILMADDSGGIWITHTLPNFPDINSHYPAFPETRAGHIITCVSLDLETINLVAATLEQVRPFFKLIKVPENLRHLLPVWLDMQASPVPERSQDTATVEFVSRYKSIHAALLPRKPGMRQCLYKDFASKRQIILDVYGESRTPSECSGKHGLRNIETISLKHPEAVHYFGNQSLADNIHFAVSTAAHWQRRGGAESQFWTCFSDLNQGESTDTGGLLLCFEQYEMWLTFDNLKVKEPECF